MTGTVFFVEVVVDPEQRERFDGMMTRHAAGTLAEEAGNRVGALLAESATETGPQADSDEMGAEEEEAPAEEEEEELVEAEASGRACSSPAPTSWPPGCEGRPAVGSAVAFLLPGRGWCPVLFLPARVSAVAPRV